MGHLRFRAVKRCGVCPNKAGSREHGWEEWALDRYQGKRNQVVGRLDGVVHHGPQQRQVRIRCVCDTCNNGWMNRLNQAAQPAIAAMASDLSMPLDEPTQTGIAR